MAGFPLGGGSGGSQQQRRDQQGGITSSEGFFLYGGRWSRSDDIVYTRGFELWQQRQIQPEQQQLYPSTGFPDELQAATPRPMRGALGGGGSGLSCQDCGNQAKKDCVHLRCRSCCKSRGFQCPTHVKSTWVPAAKRRERQQQLAAAAAVQHEQLNSGGGRATGEGCSISGGGGEPSKRPREIMACTRTPTAMATTTTYGGSLDSGSFPPEVSAQAMFRCLRVSPAVDEADDEYAYETAVTIAGHVFKGILYDHGTRYEHPSPHYQLHHDQDSSSPAVAAVTINASAGDAAIAATATAAAIELLEPYPTPLTAFVAGTRFFPHQHKPNQAKHGLF